MKTWLRRKEIGVYQLDSIDKPRNNPFKFDETTHTLISRGYFFVSSKSGGR